MFAGKPIIGIVGGIGSGKSYIADRFGELGCLVIKSDDQVRQAYNDPRVKQTIRQWWGDEVFDASGEVNRRAIAARVFDDSAQRTRLEQLLHPMIAEERDRMMAQAADDPSIVAYVWDAPLLFEAGLHRQCDAVVFVEAPLQTRLERVRQRGWDRQELEKREKSQLPLDNKKEMSDHVINNTAGAACVRSQVRDVLSRILARTALPTTPG